MEKTKDTSIKKGPPPKNRLIWGTVVFISGFFSPVFIPMVVSSGLSNGLKTVISGLLAFGIPELFMIIAAGIMGKEGFNYIKRFISILFRRYGPPDTVSKTRYTIGLIMFFLPLVFALLLPYLVDVLSFLSDNYLALSIASDVLLILSLFVLGGDFWDKLRGLFMRNTHIVFQNKNYE